jgi:DNA-binding transcriptional regulator YhcF (GntR family)
VCIEIKNKIIIEILPQSRPDMLDPEKKKEMMEGIVTEIMARMKAQGMSQDDILATIEKISKQGIEEEEE